MKVSIQVHDDFVEVVTNYGNVAYSAEYVHGDVVTFAYAMAKAANFIASHRSFQVRQSYLPEIES